MSRIDYKHYTRWKRCIDKKCDAIQPDEKRRCFICKGKLRRISKDEAADK